MYYALNLFRIYLKKCRLQIELLNKVKKVTIYSLLKGLTIKTDSFNKSFLTSFSIL